MITIPANEIASQEIGIQLYSLRNQFEKDVPGTLKMIRDWGITKIEGGENTYGMEETAFISLLENNGLDVVSVGTNMDELMDNPQEAVRRAKAFGASYVMCPWIPHDGDDFTFEDIENATNVFNSAGTLLKEQGLQLVYHPHGYEFRPYKDGTLFDYMAKNAENFDFEMDVYWVQYGGEDPMELFERYPTKFKLMHLKDMKKGTIGNDTGHSDVETNVTLGTGMIDVKALITKGKALQVEYMLIEDESSNVVQQVPKSLDFIRSIIQE
ncbi:sugar phosphate isomerase/epimerase [Flagellimonas sp. HMM57]|uniref:sugar phosphate isomerase/epimerase family protein n=1 Tax=unclassified Flagellimonas TaxID=2644544 RepID=UPI0013D11F5A|nr:MULTISPECIES: sugar phosphate isomerase/epimerase [unclassified Flagellimonas]UII76467.1 sugar phosphate isomerase/epimerase [Flagellimonas sp. HMM57]